MSKYEINSIKIQSLIAQIENKSLLIPEIQRPFVWDSTKVRDLVDSLYRGYPVGYIITWKNEDAKVKTGKSVAGSKLIIDGQQRIVALSTAIVGQEIIDKDYVKKRIVIAFNPITERFETKTPFIAKDKAWISDISIVYTQPDSYKEITDYLELNSIADDERQRIAHNIGKLFSLTQASIGDVELSHDLDIEEISEIFIRVNSKGQNLVEQDFVMSKIASVERYDGVNIRKRIDYFSHLSSSPQHLVHIQEDKDFAKESLSKISWIAQKSSTIYRMSYKDILRVVYTYKFRRGPMKYFVPLLSGRDFEKRETFETLSEERFGLLSDALNDCLNKTNYERFTMIIKSLGFVTESIAKTKTNLNFTYALYLILRSQGVSENKIEKLVSKWFVFLLLTNRYGVGSDTATEKDLKDISSMGMTDFIETAVRNQISDNFWKNTAPSKIAGSTVNNPLMFIFTASLIKNNSKAFLSSDILIRDMLDGGRGDLHHIYPKGYLKNNDVKQSSYNQVANRVYCEQAINIKLSDLSPKDYLDHALEKGFINLSESEIKANLDDLAIPHTILSGTIDNYDEFLRERRSLISLKIKEYFEAL